MLLLKLRHRRADRGHTDRLLLTDELLPACARLLTTYDWKIHDVTQLDGKIADMNYDQIAALKDAGFEINQMTALTSM